MAQKKSNSKQSESSNGKKSEKPQNAYFLSLELENIKCFAEEQKINFSDKNNKLKQWTIILGDNGTGKTTILQSLAAMTPYFDILNIGDADETIYKEFSMPVVSLSLHITNMWKPFRGFVNASSQIKANFVAQEKLKFPINYVIFHLSASNTLVRSTVTNYWCHSTVSDVLEKTKCFGYGASRKAGETSISDQNEESSFITLFDETVLLLNPEEWLLRCDYASKSDFGDRRKRKQQLKKVIEILIKILPDIDAIRFSEKSLPNKQIPQSIVEFKTKYGWVETKDLSLGYRTSMAWIVDFASRMFDLYPESENPLAEPAVVLIDEIDLHLHPKWQRELLDYLSNLFPNTQFIVTTHSPLIVQSAVARDANIVVCRREGDHVVIDQITDALKNMRVDQILTGEYFNLPTARPKEIEPFLEEREKILSKAKLTKKDEKRLTELENEIGVMPVSENPEDDKAMDIIRRAAERLESQK